MNDAHHDETKHFFGAAKLVAALTMLSRVLGLVRDMMILPMGGPVVSDQFWLAFSVPNLFRRLFGEGALSAAFVPVFSGTAERDGWARARVVLANVAGVLTLILTGLFVLIELALLGIWLAWGGDWARVLLLQLTAIMLPFMITVCLLALGSAALNCKGHFLYPAAAPILLNVGLIVTAGWLAPMLGEGDVGQFFVIAVGLILTGAVQVGVMFWVLKAADLAVVPTFRPILAEVRQIGKLMAPMLIPLSVLQFSAFADRFVAWLFTASPTSPYLPLMPGVIRRLYAANRLFQLPLGVLAISIATVVFPLFSRYAARANHAGLRDALSKALRLGAFLGIPAGAALLLLARPIVMLFFQRGDFRPYDTQWTAFILQMYCLGMCGYFWNHVLLRAFYSVKEVRTPMVLACLLAATNLTLVLIGIHTPLKDGAIGLATAITSSANALLLLWFLRKQWGQLGFRVIAASMLRTIFCAGVMSAAIWLLLTYLPGWLPGDWSPQAIAGAEIGASVVVGALVFFLAAVLVRSRGPALMLGRFRKPVAPEATEPPSDATMK